jgi:hypothetical protein
MRFRHLPPRASAPMPDALLLTFYVFPSIADGTVRIKNGQGAAVHLKFQIVTAGYKF